MEGRIFSILNTRELNGVVGVYKISFRGTNNFYIGSSKNIGIRMRNHRSDLKRNSHGNTCLINSANKYGIENCFVEVVKICNVSEIHNHEQYLIDTLKPKYNIAKKVEGGGKPSKLSDEDVLRIRFDYFNRKYKEDVQELVNKYNISIRYIVSIAHSLSFAYIKNDPTLQAHIDKNKNKSTHNKIKRQNKRFTRPYARKLTEEQVGMIRWAIKNDKSIADIGKKLDLKIDIWSVVSLLKSSGSYEDYTQEVDASHLNLLPSKKKKIGDDDVRKIKWALNQGIPRSKIIEVFGCSLDVCKDIKRNRCYTYITDVIECAHLFN